MKKQKRELLAAMFLCGCVWIDPSAVMAAEEGGLASFSLEPMIVTATRSEKRDVDVPATTSIYSQKQLESTGATTVEGALRYATGMVYKAETIGSGGGEFLIRGKRRGTLVLVDGVPLNVRTGYYDLDNISLNDVERVEVIRGGGAVLYGSDTTGGVINIITKDKKKNSVSLSFGNFGKRKATVSTQAGKLGIGAAYERMGSYSHISLPSESSNKYASKYFDFHGGNKEIISASYKFDDKWKLNADVSRHHYHRSYEYAYKDAPARYDYRDVANNEYKVVLGFKDAGWDAKAFYHRAKSNTQYTYWNYVSFPSAQLLNILDKKYSYDYTDTVYGLDAQKEWKTAKNDYLLGINLYREAYENEGLNKPSFNSKTGRFTKYSSSGVDYARSVMSVFGSLDHRFDNRDSLILSARETWTTGSPGGTEFSQFTPQVQYLHKFTDNTSYYASAGKSFTLPTMDGLFGKGGDIISNPDLKPEVGWHYETGFKHISGKHEWKLALFKSRVKDFIRQQTLKDNTVKSMNEDTKNMGVEATLAITGDNGWSSNLGVSLSNPKFYDTRYPAKGWQRSYGRVQLTGGISYQKDKFNASLNGSYLYDRVLESYQEKVKPLFTTGFRASYKPERNHEIFLNVDNVINRRDITSHVSSRYVSLPTNFELGYRYTF